MKKIANFLSNTLHIRYAWAAFLVVALYFTLVLVVANLTLGGQSDTVKTVFGLTSFYFGIRVVFSLTDYSFKKMIERIKEW